MISLTLAQLAQITQGQIESAPDTNVLISSVSTDSRKIAENCLFIALKGERFDAHDFAQQVVVTELKRYLLSAS